MHTSQQLGITYAFAYKYDIVLYMALKDEYVTMRVKRPAHRRFKVKAAKMGLTLVVYMDRMSHSASFTNTQYDKIK